jgi:hypothetical protein
MRLKHPMGGPGAALPIALRLGPERLKMPSASQMLPCCKKHNHSNLERFHQEQAEMR